MENKNKKQKLQRNILIALGVVVCLSIFTMARSIGKISSEPIDYDVPLESFAVIPINGTIQGSPSSPMDSLSYDHTAIMNYIDELIEDETNHGILLKVNSGGGTVYHSDEMYLKLMEYKEKTGRPVNAYFETIAASGAYYISCAADKIYSNRNGWTGSIGVIISFTNAKGLYDKLGLEEIIISTGENKGMGSMGSELSEEQREIYQGLVDESYETFTSIVAESRNMDIEKVKELADGRVYTAKQALENGLIDEICLYDEAVAKMEEETGVPRYEKKFNKEVSLFSYLFSSVEKLVPKSDVEAIGDLASSQLNGIPLYYYRR